MSHKRRKTKTVIDYWQSYSDMMAAMFLMFVLIMSSMLIKMQSDNETILEQRKQLERILGIKPEIVQELKKELEGFEVNIDEKTGDIEFKSDILFDTDMDVLKNEGTDFLGKFIPKYLNVVLSDKYLPSIAEIIIEGHTDTNGGYTYNLKLSQDRALSVANFIVGEKSNFVSGERKDKLRKIITVTGKSFTNPIYTDDSKKKIDASKSRRVELKFRLKDEETIAELQKILGNTADSAKNKKTHKPDQVSLTEESLAYKIICIDAGHGVNDSKEKEAIAPNSTETKRAYEMGTRGKNQTEEELNLIVAKKLEKKLKDLGAVVFMTRTTHNTDMTNIDRAKFANEKMADLTIKIHADAVEDISVNGISVLIPDDNFIDNKYVINKSKSAGEAILKKVIQSTGATDRGIVKRNDLTGFNWSNVPVILLEMGFMSNPKEDEKLETSEYQDKIVNGIIDGLIDYFN